MAESSNENALRGANLRLCRLCSWSQYTGLGFNLERTTEPPYPIRTIDSNSPAANGGLRIRDVILAVNNRDVTNSDYGDVTNAIKTAKDSGNRIDLLVIEQRNYGRLIQKGVSIDPSFAKTMETSRTMPPDYINYPQNTPRTCNITLTKNDQPFGFEVAPGEKDIGAFVQDVHPNSPASGTLLRKCDRIIEIDGKFVDKEKSSAILDKIGKAKKKNAIKLYVVDTQAYKYFQENNIPLASKAFKKHPLSKQQQPASYMNVDEPPPEDSEPEDGPPPPASNQSTIRGQPQPSSNQSTIRGQPQPSSNQSTIREYPQPSPPYELPDEHEDDIRLCTITRNDPTDTFGFELITNKREQNHTLKLRPNRTTGISNAELAGIQPEDHLIEINGENIEELDTDQVKKRVLTTTYPQPLRLLVANAATYDYYKEQGMRIHSGLPNIQKLPATNISGRTASTVSSTHQQPISRPISHTTSSTADKPPTGLTGLVQQNPLRPISSTDNSQSNRRPISSIENSQSNRRQYRLKRSPSFDGFGFRVSAEQEGSLNHKIVNIALNSPAEQQGLRVGDFILTVNNENVQDMNSDDFKIFLRNAAKTSEERGNPLILEVINEDSYESPAIPYEPFSQRPSSRKPSTLIEDYPEMRLCTIRPWPHKRHLGFEINPPTNAYVGYDGHRIQLLESDSPAAHTNIHNGDYIIEVNGENIERQNSQYVKNLINTVYQREQHIKLLIIDDNGYRWYKNHNYPINPSHSNAKVKYHTTPDRPPTDTLSSVDTRKSWTRHGSSGSRPSQHERPILPITKPPPTQTYTNGYTPSTLNRSRPNLSRGAVDVVSEKRLLRFCRLLADRGKSFGFELIANNDRHIVNTIEPDSPATRAGLHENDRIIEIDNQNIENKTSQEVDDIIRNAAHNGVLCLFVAPHSVKPVAKRSTKSLSKLNDDHYYRQTTGSIYDEQDRPSTSISKHRSLSRLNDEQINRNRTNTLNNFNEQLSQPTEPLPRKCLIKHDQAFRGCGFRLSEKENFDTPIVIEVLPNSPAKRSGLTEGDHIVYIEKHNIQNFRSFDEMTNFIQRKFEQNGEVTITALTGQAFQVLKRRGGYLDNNIFDYQSLSNIDKMKPRLCKLNLYNYENDFGFSLKRLNTLSIKTVDKGSSADINGLKRDDIILEINGENTKYLPLNQIKEIIEKSKLERKLDILVIDEDGYQYSIKHAIPLNSLLSFVQTNEGQNMRSTNHTPNEAVYL